MIFILLNGFQKRWPTTRILLISPPPIDEDGRLRYDSALNLRTFPPRYVYVMILISVHFLIVFYLDIGKS